VDGLPADRAPVIGRLKTRHVVFLFSSVNLVGRARTSNLFDAAPSGAAVNRRCDTSHLPSLWGGSHGTFTFGHQTRGPLSGSADHGPNDPASDSGRSRPTPRGRVHLRGRDGEPWAGLGRPHPDDVAHSYALRLKVSGTPSTTTKMWDVWLGHPMRPACSRDQSGRRRSTESALCGRRDLRRFGVLAGADGIEDVALGDDWLGRWDFVMRRRARRRFSSRGHLVAVSRPRVATGRPTKGR